MKPHRPELADVFRAHQSEVLARWNQVLSRQQRKALKDIRPSCSSNAIFRDIDFFESSKRKG